MKVEQGFISKLGKQVERVLNPASPLKILMGDPSLSGLRGDGERIIDEGLNDLAYKHQLSAVLSRLYDQHAQETPFIKISPVRRSSKQELLQYARELASELSNPKPSERNFLLGWTKELLHYPQYFDLRGKIASALSDATL